MQVNVYKNLEKNYNELVKNYNNFKESIINLLKSLKVYDFSDYDVGYNKGIEESITVVSDMSVPLIFKVENQQFILTRLEYELLKFWNSKKYKYIARDFSGMLFIYYEKPSKKSEIWGSKYAHCILDDFDELFQFVQWEDSEPTSIQEVLENCEVVESD